MKTRLLLLLIGILLPFQMATAASEPEYPAEVTFTLRTAVAEGKLVYIGQEATSMGRSILPFGCRRTPWYRSI
ncbi:hypothetical protein HML84_18140 [Alcanivorax sp. IO_7]|nr:hypothetical protein HML84_18140 [Alcanivorax sp. IO_7]